MSESTKEELGVVATWPTLQPGQVRWIGEWEDMDDTLSYRFFVGRHPEGAMFAGDAYVRDTSWAAPCAPWQRQTPYRGTVPDRAAAKLAVEHHVLKTFNVTP